MINRFSEEIIEKYLGGIEDDSEHRYKSWENCFNAFSINSQTEYHALQLAFYLASWGMYRGSGGLLQKNHLIHQGAVDILFSEEFKILKCNIAQEVSKDKIDSIINLQKRLSDYYGSISYTRGSEKLKLISATDTLISKVLLGTFACIPAYDRYLLKGLKENGLKNSKFGAESIIELFDFIEENKNEIAVCQKSIQIKTKMHYPIIKILDMYFWQIGFDKEIDELNNLKGK